MLYGLQLYEAMPEAVKTFQETSVLSVAAQLYSIA